MPFVSDTGATTLWCAPFAFATTPTSGSSIGDTGSIDTTGRPRCISHRCMLWTWADGTKTTTTDLGYCGFTQFRTRQSF